MLSLPSRQVEECSEPNVSKDYQKRGLHNRSGGRPANRIRASAHAEAFQTSDMHDDCCEGQAFGQAYDDVTENNRVHDVSQVNAKRHLRAETHEEAPSENSGSTANDRQA